MYFFYYLTEENFQWNVCKCKKKKGFQGFMAAAGFYYKPKTLFIKGKGYSLYDE